MLGVGLNGGARARIARLTAAGWGGSVLTPRFRLAVVVAAVVAVLVGVAPAVAAPTVSDKQAEARRVKSQIDELDRKVEIAAEAYNEANMKHAAIVADIQETQAELDAANARIGELDVMLSTRAESMYRSGPLSFLEVLLDASSFEEFASTWDLLTDINAGDAEAIAELKAVRREAERTANVLADREAEAKAVLDQMTANKNAVESQLAERQRLLAGIEGEIQALEAAEQARAEAAARAAVSRSRASSSAGTERSFPPPTRAPRSEVVNIAMKYLGAPYRWGASGPNAFDCSGFTMFVYGQVGVSLPHSSRAQYGSGQRVSRADLQPGDLVFFGSPIHHVGIYVGGGQYIHSPRTGDVVKVSPLSRGDYVGACRP